MYYLISINLIGFILIFIDKRKAIHYKWRIPENILLLNAFIGGCFGMLISMYLFRHKTRKLKFKLIHLFCIIWLYFFFSTFNLLEFNYLI